MDTTGFFLYFGLPTFFIMLCMTAAGWASSANKLTLTQKLSRWVCTWGSLGCLLAIVLAVTAWIMNTDFVYSHASIVWPFCLSLVALDGHPSIVVGSLLVCMMGAINGLYYAVLAFLTWKVVRLLLTKSHFDRGNS